MRHDSNVSWAQSYHGHAREEDLEILIRTRLVDIECNYRFFR
jgi:hypothetical protein